MLTQRSRSAPLRRPWIAWSLAILAWLLAIAGPLLALRGGEALALGEAIEFGSFAALTFGTIGALIAARHPRNPVGWIFLAVGLLEALAEFAGQYARLGLIHEPGLVPAPWLAAWLADWVWFPGFAMLGTYALLFFPDGRLPSRRWRPVAWGVAASLMVMLAAVLAVLPQQPGRMSVETGPEGPVVEALGGAAFVALLALAPLCLASLFFRYRMADGIQRQQLKAFAYAGTLTVAILIAISMDLDRPFVTAGQIAVAILLPGAAAVAIFRYRLFDIDVVINRTLVYVGLSGLVAGVYAAVVVGAHRVMERSGLGVSIFATGLVAVLALPLRGSLQRGVDRMMYGERGDPYRLMAGLGRRLEATLTAGEVLPTITRTIAEALRLPCAKIEVRDGDGFQTAAVYGDPVPEMERLPVLHRGREVARLVVAPRRRGEHLSPRDRALLEDLGRQIGAAAETVRLTSDLRASRARLVSAREEERRRIRRDLHDGLGPTLAGIAMQLEVAQSATQDAATAGRLRGLRNELDRLIREVRRLVYDLRPPALDQLGLVGALRAHAASLPGGLAVSFDAPDLGELPAAVEVAAYRIVGEAITNAARHAGASSCSVRLRAGGQLEIEVRDDGRGIGPDASPGVGLTSMQERAVELEGSLEISSAPGGGTVVRARLPAEAFG